MKQPIDLREVYNDAALSMQQCMRAVSSAIDTNSEFDLDPSQLTDLITHLMGTLATAQVHVDAMESTQRLLDRGYRQVSVQLVNPGVGYGRAEVCLTDHGTRADGTPFGHGTGVFCAYNCGICGDHRHLADKHGKG